MVQKVQKENLYVIHETEGFEKVVACREMEFAITRVIIIVVNDEEKVVGIISPRDFETRKADSIADCVNKNFAYLTEGYNNLEKVAQVTLNSHNYYLLPVLDDEGRLLYAYQKCNFFVEQFKNYMQSRFSLEAVLALSEDIRIHTGKQVSICSDLWGGGKTKRTYSY